MGEWGLKVHYEGIQNGNDVIDTEILMAILILVLSVTDSYFLAISQARLLSSRRAPHKGPFHSAMTM